MPIEFLHSLTTCATPRTMSGGAGRTTCATPRTMSGGAVASGAGGGATMARKTIAVNTAEKQRGRPFQPGESGNPFGRPKGSRNKLAEAFIADVYADWLEHGILALVRVREKQPAAYLRVVAALLPQHIEVS